MDSLNDAEVTPAAQGLQHGRDQAEPDFVNGGDRENAGSLQLTLLLYVVQGSALLVVVVLRHFGLVANEPLWAFALAIVGSSVLSQRLDRWIDAPRGSWRLHVRVFVHALTVMSVIYLTGWGPALGMCFVYTALVDLQQSGPASWRAVLGWSLICCAAGQMLVLVGWAPVVPAGHLVADARVPRRVRVRDRHRHGRRDRRRQAEGRASLRARE